MRCSKCGKDIAVKGELYTIYEGKEWCECKTNKDLESK